MSKVLLRLMVCTTLLCLALASAKGQQHPPRRGQIVFGATPKKFYPVQQAVLQQSQIDAARAAIETIESGRQNNLGGLAAAQSVTGSGLGRNVEATLPEPQPRESLRPINNRNGTITIPIANSDPNATIETSGSADRMSLKTSSAAELTTVLRTLADEHDLNLVLGPKVGGPVTVSISDAKLDDVLNAIFAVGGYAWSRHEKLLCVKKVEEGEPGLDPRVQGLQTRVFPLNYVAATDVQVVVAGLLSPDGQALVTESSKDDQRRTQEVLVISDIPEGVSRVASFLAQVDQPPRQVLIEAHVLQVVLDDDLRHGVNLQALASAAGSEIEFRTIGLADGNASPGATLGINGSDLNSVVELIRTYNNTQTLASPKVLVVNRQEARIQIGSQLGYFVTTTTQTGTFQSVEFLDTGVVLTVEPIISDTGEILMTVTPEVSGGRINALGLPEEETTEVTSTILLPDGGGVVMGGLIRDADEDTHSFVPVLGRIPKIGKFFSRHVRGARREEIIIALVTHIVPTVEEIRNHELNEIQQALPPHAIEALRRPGYGSPVHGIGVSPQTLQLESPSPVLEAIHSH